MSQRITFDQCAWPLVAVSAARRVLAALGLWRLFTVSGGGLLGLPVRFFRDLEGASA